MLADRLSDLSLRASGADGADHDCSLDLNAAVAAVEAPPAEPSGQPGPSGLPAGAPLDGSPSDIADELGSDFRRGQRVVRALLDETETAPERRSPRVRFAPAPFDVSLYLCLASVRCFPP